MEADRVNREREAARQLVATERLAAENQRLREAVEDAFEYISRMQDKDAEIAARTLDVAGLNALIGRAVDTGSTPIGVNNRLIPPPPFFTSPLSLQWRRDAIC